jgi:ferric-dicitrate binding protein FerR (iron transport regulator)
LTRYESQENEKLFSEYKELWMLARTNSPDFSQYEEQDWLSVKKETVDTQKGVKNIAGGFLFYAFRIAAILVLGLGVVFIIYYKNSGNLKEQFASNRNSRIDLDDGTTVWLNKNSQLRFPEKMNGKTREVYLEGEGFFEVAHNPSKPFIIHTGKTLTQVVGTSFNIDGSKAEEEISVNVVTGKVAFSLDGDVKERVELTPGELGIWSKENGRVTETKGNPNAMAWHTETLLFEKTTMGSIISTLSSYYNIEIELADQSIANCRFTGTFQQAELEEVLKTLSLTLGISYEMSGDRIIIKGQGC